MSTINKVPASAGAEWLLAGFALLKRAPVPLATLAVLWGLLSMVVMLVAVTLPAMTLAMQFLLDAWKAAKVAAGRMAPVPIQGAPD